MIGPVTTSLSIQAQQYPGGDCDSAWWAAAAAASVPVAAAARRTAAGVRYLRARQGATEAPARPWCSDQAANAVSNDHCKFKSKYGAAAAGAPAGSPSHWHRDRHCRITGKLWRHGARRLRMGHNFRIRLSQCSPVSLLISVTDLLALAAAQIHDAARKRPRVTSRGRARGARRRVMRPHT